MEIKFDPKITELLEFFKLNNIDVYLVGGYLRDYLSNKECFDLDFSLVSSYKEALSILKNKYDVSYIDEYGCIKFKLDEYEIEITHARKEREYLDYRHPYEIEFVTDIKEDYLRRADFIRSSYVINKNIAVCPLTIPLTTKEELAEIAEELLTFEYVEASFAIGQLKGNQIGISARSIGNVNVCEIMKRLGGGGHITNAASQISDSTVKEVERQLCEVLGER